MAYPYRYTGQPSYRHIKPVEQIHIGVEYIKLFSFQELIQARAMPKDFIDAVQIAGFIDFRAHRDGFPFPKLWRTVWVNCHGNRHIVAIRKQAFCQSKDERVRSSAGKAMIQ